MAMERHGVQAVPRHPRVVGHGLPELRVESHPRVRRVVSRLPVHVHLVRRQVGKQMRVVPDGRLEIHNPCLGPREVIRYAGAAEPRGHRNVQGNALRGQGMHDRVRVECRAAALASVQNRLKINVHTCAQLLQEGGWQGRSEKLNCGRWGGLGELGRGPWEAPEGGGWAP